MRNCLAYARLMLGQWFSTRVPPVQSRGSARTYTTFHFILSIKLNAVFLHKTIELLHRDFSSHWKGSLEFRFSKKVENYSTRAMLWQGIMMIKYSEN